MFCGKCGNKINAGEKFCSYCGNQIETGEFAQTRVNALNLIKTNEKRKLLVPIIIGSVGIFLVIVLVVVALFNGRNNADNNSETFHSSTTETSINTTSDVSTTTTTTETATVSTTQKETTTKATTTTKPTTSSVYLEATANELKQLQDFLNSTACTTDSLCTSYNCNNISYTQFVENYLFFVSGDSFVYGKYFNAPVYNYEDTPDPLNKFMAVDYEWKNGQYFKYSKSNIDWIMKNIYNIPSSTISSFSANSIEDDDTYYKDGYIYQEKHVGFGSSGLYIEVNSHTRLNDGRYSVSFTEINEFSGKPEGRATAIVSMKNINGKRYWTLHSIS